jgi:hypothetical protein
MTSFRIVGMGAASLLVAVTLGGCPLADGLPGEAAPAADSLDGSADADGATGEATTLGELVSGIMEGDSGEELAWSYGSSWVYTGSGYCPDGAYPPGYNPYHDESGIAGTGSGGNEGGASDGNGRSGGGGSDGSGDGGSGQASGSGSAMYSGTVDCFRHETLEGYGELSEEMTFPVTVGFDDQGVPTSVPFPLFIERIMVYPDVRHVGDTDTFTVPSTPTATWTVTVTVVSATYTPQTASVVLEIDTGWVGEHSSVTASGVHTLQTEVVGTGLSYSSETHYDAEFRAADDWQGEGTEDFDCTGTLMRQ